MTQPKQKIGMEWSCDCCERKFVTGDGMMRFYELREIDEPHGVCDDCY